MIKNNRKPIQFLLITSLCLIIFSCKGDEEEGGPDLIYGSWTSGELSYHLNLDCSGDGMFLEEFTDSVIKSNIVEEANFGATTTCSTSDNPDFYLTIGYDTLEECIDAERSIQIENLSNLMSPLDTLKFQNKISYNYNYNDMDLTIYEGTDGLSDHYAMSYNGTCIQTDEYIGGTFNQSACNNLYDALLNPGGSWNGTECIFISRESCEDIANGYWDAEFFGPMSSDGENYSLEDFFGVEGNVKEIIFDGYSIFLIMTSTEDECICGDDGTIEELDAPSCVLTAQDCVFIEDYCVSYSFVK